MNGHATQVAAENEGPPDAGATRQALRQATQMAEAASGLAILVTAAGVAAAFGLLYGLGDRSAPYYLAGWIAILCGLGVAYWALFFWIQKRRTKAGLPVVEARRPGPLKIALLAVGLVLYIVVGAGVALLLRGSGAYHLMLIVPFGVVYGTLWCIHGVQVCGWEDVVLGSGLIIISAFPLHDRAFPPEVWAILFAACFVFSGLVKHLRWRRWVRTVGAESSPAAPEGGAS